MPTPRFLTFPFTQVEVAFTVALSTSKVATSPIPFIVVYAPSVFENAVSISLIA